MVTNHEDAYDDAPPEYTPSERTETDAPDTTTEQAEHERAPPSSEPARLRAESPM